MNESTPFKKKNFKRYCDDVEQQQRELSDTSGEYEDLSMTSSTKYTLWSTVVIVTLAMLYFFTFMLPNMFVPEATVLVTIKNISELKVSLLPGDEDDNKKTPVSRLILIGDVHGHYFEFRKLLTKMNYNPKKDHIVVLGDFITKGPDSIKLLDYLIDHHIDCILGNHEFYVLQFYATFHGLDQPEFMFNSPSPISTTTTTTTPISSKGSVADDPEFLLAKRLQPRHVKYINSCSVIKKLGSVPNGLGAAVHAGLRPDLTLQEQDPMDNLEMRSLIGPHYNETTSDPDEPLAKSWSKIYNSKKGEYPADHVVYYGHDAGRGLQLKKFTKGLDSGCDKGDRLSAMVISHNGKKLVEEVVLVHC